jgi:hypothetical protein
MNQLPLQAIDEFQALWKKHYGTELSREEAVLRAHQTLSLLRLLTDQPAPEKKRDAALAQSQSDN